MEGDTSAHSALTFRQRIGLFTPMLTFLTVFISLAAFNFGYDVGTFGGVQGMKAFAQKFGRYEKDTKLWALPAYLSSIMTSTPFLGKLIGTLSCGPVAERYGRKTAILILACISLVGVTLQVSATTAAQFTAGRIINFAMTGFTIVVVPIFQSECAPAELRGMISATLQLQIGVGQLVASLVNYGTKNMKGDVSWLIPTGLQLVVPVVILVLLPLMPESPRWLMSKGRREDALEAMIRLRKKDTPVELLREEMELLAMADANQGKGAWKEIFQGTNKVRTIIAIAAMFFQQITGQAFVSQYSVIFYQRQKIANPFGINVIQSVVVLVAITFTSLVVDSFGRRPILLTGGSLMSFFLFLLGAVGATTHRPPTPSQKHTMVSSIVLFATSYALSWGPLSYTILGETATSRLKEKTNNLATSISVVTTFVVSFTLPYLLNPPYAALGPKVGFVYGSASAVSVAVAWLWIPEMKGRSLEEVDEMFEKKVPLRSFRGYQTEWARRIDTTTAAAAAAAVSAAAIAEGEQGTGTAKSPVSFVVSRTV